MTPYARARLLIDTAHAADPKRTPDGQPAELRYADQVEAWVHRLRPEAEPLLLLAARCQHLERWRVPRDTFPMDRAGYLAWRRSLYTRQAERARELLREAGVPSAEAAEAATWISKTGLKVVPGTQALEDGAVLVFLESEIADFVQRHQEYTLEKFSDILRKTWRKLSPTAQNAARALPLPALIAELVAQVDAESKMS